MAAEQLELALPWVAVRREPEPAQAELPAAVPAWAAEEAARAAGDKNKAPIREPFFVISEAETGVYPFVHGLRSHCLDLRPP